MSRLNFKKIAYMLTPWDLREPTTLAFIYSYIKPLSDRNAIQLYSDTKTYNPGDRVSFKFRTFEAADNTATQGGFSGKMPVTDNQITTDGSGNPYWKEVDFRTFYQIREENKFYQTFRANIIYLEHYLNARLNNNAIDPYSDQSYIGLGKRIYIEDLTGKQKLFLFAKKWNKVGGVVQEDEIFLYPRWDSTISYSPDEYAIYPYSGGERVYKANTSTTIGQDPQGSSEWDFVEEAKYLYPKLYYNTARYRINVPVEVKNTLTPIYTDWKEVVKAEVDRYNFAGMDYEIQTY